MSTYLSKSDFFSRVSPCFPGFFQGVSLDQFIGDNANRQIVLVSESSNDYPPIVIGENDGIDYLAQAKILCVVKSPSIT